MKIIFKITGNKNSLLIPMAWVSVSERKKSSMSRYRDYIFSYSRCFTSDYYVLSLFSVFSGYSENREGFCFSK